MGGARPPSLPLPLVKIGLALVCGLAVGCMLAGLKGCAVAPRREPAPRGTACGLMNMNAKFMTGTGASSRVLVRRQSFSWACG